MTLKTTESREGSSIQIYIYIYIYVGCKGIFPCERGVLQVYLSPFTLSVSARTEASTVVRS